MPEIFNQLFQEITFIFARFNAWSMVDIALVMLVFFALFSLLRDTQAFVLLRGVLLLIVLISLLTSLDVLPAFSWLMRTTLPALLLAVPVIFAPEIRRALERLGRAGGFFPVNGSATDVQTAQDTITALVTAAARLSARRHGALIVMQRSTDLSEYIRTGVQLDARITPEILLQVFYPNTPLHDGAAILRGDRLIAGACVMPLSSSGILTGSPERQMGLRHRAALGISEVSDAIVLVVSEETGGITIVNGGRMIRRLEPERVETILRAIFRPTKPGNPLQHFFKQVFLGKDSGENLQV
ncbi:MAG: diadenylate cyclase CdaA [Anaerolineales bacterium]